MSESNNGLNVLLEKEVPVEVVEDLEWEEWDGVSPFWHHCIAGSLAGVAEHVLFYPVDTVKTHMQSYCDNCPHNNQNQNMKLKPTTATTATSSSSSSSSSSISSYHHSRNGMWSTMRSLIQTGHAVGGTSTTKPNATTTTATATTTATTKAATTTSAGRQRPATTLVSVVCDKQPPIMMQQQQQQQSLLLQKNGFGRLWRGVQTMAVGCVPAHALYFSLYELVKPYNAGLAGAMAALGHDMVMTPLDTVKQRLQLGHYRGDMTYAVRTIYQQEGWLGLYRSFPITLLTNVPYGILMVSTNEYLRHYLTHYRHHDLPSTSTQQPHLDLTSTMMAGCGAGAVASALTTPLDCLKTRLQTQRLLAMSIQDTCSTSSQQHCNVAKYSTVPDAIRVILKEDGMAGFFRGITPRIVTHTPAVAISWTTYEIAKSWLAQTTHYFSSSSSSSSHNPHL